MDRKMEMEEGLNENKDTSHLVNGRCPFCKYKIEITEDDNDVVIKSRTRTKGDGSI